MKKFLAILVSFSLIFASSLFFCNAESSKGDVNCDGIVNSTDALIVLQYVVGTIEKINSEEIADLNADGIINSADALEILKIVVGIVGPETPNEPTIPSTKEKIIECYNNAINKVINEKASYKKTTTSELGSLEGAESLMKLQVARDAVYDFLGIGENTYSNNKGESKWLTSASLTDSDVVSATLVKNDNIYKVTLKLIDGTSSAPNGTDTSPLNRCGLYVGSNVEKEYDYKSSANFYKGINDADGVTVQSIKETTKNSVLVAEIDSETGNLISLSVNFNWVAELTKLKYTFITVSGKGNATTSVKVSDINW